MRCPAVSRRRARQVQGVVLPPLAGLRAALALAVRLARALDPQVGVDERVGRAGRRGLAERPAGRVAPALVRIALGVGTVAVAAGVDDEVLSADLGGQLLAVGDGVLGGVEVRDVHREAVGPVESGPLERLVDLVGVAPARVARVHVHLGVLQALQRGDGAVEEVVALLVELLRGAAVDQVQHRVRLQHHRRRAVPDALGHRVHEVPVGVTVGGPALRVLPAVAVRDVVEDQHRAPADLVGALGELPGLLLGLLRVDPLRDGLLGDLPQLPRLGLPAVPQQFADLARRDTVRVDPEGVRLLRLLRDDGRGRALLAVVTPGGTSREQQRRPQHRCGRPPPANAPTPCCRTSNPLGALVPSVPSPNPGISHGPPGRPSAACPRPVTAVGDRRGVLRAPHGRIRAHLRRSRNATGPGLDVERTLGGARLCL